MTTTPLKIGGLARGAGVAVDTVRYYERMGLLPKPRRSSAGYRLYGEPDVARLRFIRRARSLGFHLDQIRELLELSHRHGEACTDARRRAEARIAEIDRRIASLGGVRDGLRELVTACASRTPTGECPILAVLDGDGDTPVEPAARPAERVT